MGGGGSFLCRFEGETERCQVSCTGTEALESGRTCAPMGRRAGARSGGGGSVCGGLSSKRQDRPKLKGEHV